MYEVIFNRAANKLSTFTACGLTADSVTQRRKSRCTVGSPEPLQGPRTHRSNPTGECFLSCLVSYVFKVTLKYERKTVRKSK